MCKPWKDREENGAEKLSFGTKPTWIQIHLLPTIKHVTLGNCLSSLGLSFQMCKNGITWYSSWGGGCAA